MITWMKRREDWPWEKPWEDTSRAPFKVRFLREDPAGVALALAQQGKLQLQQGKVQGKEIVSISIPKPTKPWWRPF